VSVDFGRRRRRRKELVKSEAEEEYKINGGEESALRARRE
jgi:hypothetical protein